MLMPDSNEQTGSGDEGLLPDRRPEIPTNGDALDFIPNDATEIEPPLALEKIEPEPDNPTLLRRAVSDALKRPAMSAMAEVLRGDHQLFDTVRAFTARRHDFTADYNVPGRSTVPWMMGARRADKELFNLAVHESLEDKRGDLVEALEGGAKTDGYLYSPLVTLGLGPAGQIFLSQVAATNPELAEASVGVDKDESGGPFGPSRGMNFFVNSSTRPQVDGVEPRPGTRTNLNDFSPGPVTPGVRSASTYVGAQDFGDTARENLILNPAQIGQYIEVVGYQTDRPGANSDLPGQADIIVQDVRTGSRYTLRTEALFIAGGLGEPNLDSFVPETRDLIKRGKELIDEGRSSKARVVTYEDYYRKIADDPFPFQGIKKIAFVGNEKSDSTKTAAGTALGYEDRTDGSVTQLDWVREVVFLGAGVGTDKEFAEITRFRYAILAQEFPRQSNLERFSRIRNGGSDKVTEIDLVYREIEEEVLVTDEQGTRKVKQTRTEPVPSIKGEEYDLVVVATGYKDTTEQWLQDSQLQALSAGSERVRNALSPSDESSRLTAGDIVQLPEGFNIKTLQILANVDNEEGDPAYKVLVTKSDGQAKVIDVDAYASFDPDRRSLSDLCGPSVFEREDAEIDLAPDDPEVEASSLSGITLTGAEFNSLSAKDQQRYIDQGIIYGQRNIGIAPRLLVGVSDGDDGSSPEFTVEELVMGSQGELLRNQDGLPSRQTLLSLLPETSFLVSNDVLTGRVSAERREIDGQPSLAEIRGLLENGAVIYSSRDPETGAGRSYANLFLAKSTSGEEELYITTPDGIVIGALFSSIEDLYETGEFNGNLSARVPEQIDGSNLETVSEAAPASLLSKEDFERLDNTEKKKYIRPGTVIVPKAGNGEVISIRFADFVDGVVVTELFEPDNIGLRVDGASNRPNIDNFLLDGDAIINNPALVSDRPKQPVELSGLDRFERTDVIRNLLNSGAVIYGAPSSSGDGMQFSSLFKAESMSGDSILYGALMPGENISRLDKSVSASVRFLFEAGYFDGDITARLPEKEEDATQVGVFEKPSAEVAEIADKPAVQLIDYRSSTGELIARKVADQPVIVIGAASKVPLEETPDLVNLIPGLIEENVAAIFKTGREVRRVARRQASLLSSATARAVSVSRAVEANGAKDSARPSTANFTVTIPNIAETARKIPRGVSRISTDRLLKFGLDQQVRELGLTYPFDEEGSPVSNMTVIAGSDGELEVKVVGSPVINEQEATMILSSPYVNTAIRRMLEGGRVRGLDLALPFDRRGLDLDNLRAVQRLSGRNQRKPADQSV